MRNTTMQRKYFLVIGAEKSTESGHTPTLRTHVSNSFAMNMNTGVNINK
jgi:hypothetical protein